MTTEQTRLWPKLRAVAWIILTATLGFFLFRELRPSPVARADEGPVSLLLLMGAATLGGAMLVGAKLATAPAGSRPSFREMLMLVVAPPFLTGMAFTGINQLGGGTVQTYVAPVIAAEVVDKDYLVQTVGPDGRVESFAIAVGVPPSERNRWQNFGGLKVGQCMERQWRSGLLDLPVDVGWKPVACPSGHGTPPPEGPLHVEFVGSAPSDWRWGWHAAEEGSLFPVWRRQLYRIVRDESEQLIGMELGMIARLEPDGSVGVARLSVNNVPVEVADRLTSSLVGTVDVIRRPDELTAHPGPLWVRVPVRVVVMEPPEDDPA